MHEALKSFFEEQVEFRDKEGTPIEGSVFIGNTELFPVETLRGDEDAYRDEFNTWLETWLPLLEDRRNQILGLHGNYKRFADLCNAVARRQVIPLVGSGMSVPTGLPTWSELLLKMKELTDVRPDKLEELLADGAFEEAADLLASGTNLNWFNERIEHDLRVDDASFITGAVRLLPALFPGLVITTNLDDLLERQYRRCGADFTHILAGQEIARYRQLKTPTQRFLLKLHGDCRRVETRVLLKFEYEAAYAPGSITREELALLYRTSHLLFLGCSLGSDRTIQLVEEVARSDKHMPRHYAFLASPEFHESRVSRENFLTSRGIYPIWYDGVHDESILALLAGLLDAAGAGQARVRP